MLLRPPDIVEDDLMNLLVSLCYHQTYLLDLRAVPRQKVIKGWVLVLARKIHLDIYPSFGKFYLGWEVRNMVTICHTSRLRVVLFSKRSSISKILNKSVIATYIIPKFGTARATQYRMILKGSFAKLTEPNRIYYRHFLGFYRPYGSKMSFSACIYF